MAPFLVELEELKLEERRCPFFEVVLLIFLEVGVSLLLEEGRLMGMGNGLDEERAGEEGEEEEEENEEITEATVETLGVDSCLAGEGEDTKVEVLEGESLFLVGEGGMGVPARGGED